MNTMKEIAMTKNISEDDASVCLTKRETAEKPSKLSIGNPSSVFFRVSFLKLLTIISPFNRKAKAFNNNKHQTMAATTKYLFGGLKSANSIKNKMIIGTININIAPIFRQYELRIELKLIFPVLPFYIIQL